MSKFLKLLSTLALFTLSALGQQGLYRAYPPGVGPQGINSGVNVTLCGVSQTVAQCQAAPVAFTSDQAGASAITAPLVVGAGQAIQFYSAPGNYNLLINFLGLPSAGQQLIPINVPPDGAGNVALADGIYHVPLGVEGGCELMASTGALGSAATGTTNPGPLRVAANQWVYELITTAAANVVALECDITPPSRLTSGKGAIIQNIQVMYGVQTTALTSITAPTLSSNTFPATGGAAANTVAGAGGSLTVLPASLQLATTTSGLCYSENVALGTPVTVGTDLQRVTLEQLFNQTAAAATQLQICDVIVHYKIPTM